MPSQSEKTSADRLERPALCSEEEIARFLELVEQAEEVQSAGLDKLVRAAPWLAFHYEQDSVVGIAGLKRPRPSYREKVFRQAQIREQAAMFATELGWVYTVEPWRGHGIGRRLVAQLLAKIPGEPVFATTRLDNAAMQRILMDHDFQNVGRPFLGRDQYSLLQLWTHRQVDT